MALIAGLGNIGPDYEGTRHNIGFELADRLAEKLSARFTLGDGPFLIAEGSFKGEKIYLIKPTTYMNRSGSAVSRAAALTDTRFSDCLISYDDINLPAGKIRYRPSGSAGGHNGIKDIINRLQTNKFPRLRIGIGGDFARGRQADYVLSPFTSDQRNIMDETLNEAVESVFTYLRGGIEMAMNNYN